MTYDNSIETSLESIRLLTDQLDYKDVEVAPAQLTLKNCDITITPYNYNTIPYEILNIFSFYENNKLLLDLYEFYKNFDPSDDLLNAFLKNICTVIFLSNKIPVILDEGRDRQVLVSNYIIKDELNTDKHPFYKGFNSDIYTEPEKAAIQNLKKQKEVKYAEYLSICKKMINNIKWWNNSSGEIINDVDYQNIADKELERVF